MFPLLLSAGFFQNWAAAWGENIGGIVLLVIGMILITVEMIIPGFGAAGVSGVVALIAGLVIGSNDLPGAMFSLLIVVILLAIIAVLIFKSAIRGKLSRSPVVLNTAIESGSTDLLDEDHQSLVGKTGRTVTALRPSGIAVIDGRRMDVVSDNEFIDRDRNVQVVSVDGVKVLVKSV